MQNLGSQPSLIRREFLLALLSTPAIVVPSRASGRQTIGFLAAGSEHEFTQELSSFLQGLRNEGISLGQNVTIQYRWANGNLDALPNLAEELVALGVDVVASTGGLPTVLAAKKATSSIPIVFSMGDDPLALGIVDSLTRPSGNATGSTFLSLAFSAKRVELARELLPSARTIALLSDSSATTSDMEKSDFHDAAEQFGFKASSFSVDSIKSIKSRMDEIIAERPDVLVPSGSVMLTTYRSLVLMPARDGHLPVIGTTKHWTRDGAVATYAGNVNDSYQRVGEYVGRVLHGAKPSELPVILPCKFELSINIRAVRELGIAVPAAIMFRADEIIQ